MMMLIEDREKKLAERGIFTIEQEIEEIEKRNQELLDKVNEGRINKIDKVEVYKPDEFDDIEDKAPETEKTKGQEFAEHLKRQFAALDDEQVSFEDLIAIQDFEEAESEKHKKEGKNKITEINKQQAHINENEDVIQVKEEQTSDEEEIISNNDLIDQEHKAEETPESSDEIISKEIHEEEILFERDTRLSNNELVRDEKN